MNNIDRFLRYVKIDTQSDDTTHVTPSTEKQKDLGHLLVKELKELGIEDAYMDEWGIVYGHLKGEGELTIGVNAHMDTALEVTGKNVKSKIISNYDGRDIALNENVIMKVENFPRLKKYVGNDLVVTDGTTLLGADDKAGIGIIMSVLEYFHNHPEVKHHNISICFTVDEEIGEGALHFSLEKMKADYAYTIDGGEIDCIDYENFNAKAVKINIKGVSIHPGEGKNALINALIVANDFINTLPHDETPFDSELDQGYWHLNSIDGTSDEATIEMILRDFEHDGMNRRVQQIEDGIKAVQSKYPKAQVSYSIRDQYLNMKPFVEKHPDIIIKAEVALINNGIKPRHTKIRGGTDGATFSKMGLPTPNLGTGSYNHHGRFEFLVIQEYEKMISVLVDILKIS